MLLFLKCTNHSTQVFSHKLPNSYTSSSLTSSSHTTCVTQVLLTKSHFECGTASVRPARCYWCYSVSCLAAVEPAASLCIFSLLSSSPILLSVRFLRELVHMPDIVRLLFLRILGLRDSTTCKVRQAQAAKSWKPTSAEPSLAEPTASFLNENFE